MESDQRSTPKVKTVPGPVRSHTEAHKTGCWRARFAAPFSKIAGGEKPRGTKRKRPLHLADAAAFWKTAFEAKNYALRRLRASAPSPMNNPPTIAIVAGSGTVPGTPCVT